MMMRGQGARPADIPRPPLRQGDQGAAVAYMQSLLPHDHDGDFGPVTDEEVRDYQRSRGLTIDGVVGPATWDALESGAPPVLPTLPSSSIAAIMMIASSSEIANYSWAERGFAPEGYTAGMALAFAQSYLRLKAGHPAIAEMAKANTGDEDIDALAWYADDFEALELDIEQDGAETLRGLYTLLMGLGMRESSGRHCEGRDQSASNTSADTAEAGLFQTSYDAHACCDAFDPLMDEFTGGETAGLSEAFAIDVSCSDAEWDCYGSGRGAEFQRACKEFPAFAVESCALTLRNLRQHYGPINRKEAEVKAEAARLFRQVQAYVDWIIPDVRMAKETV